MSGVGEEEEAIAGRAGKRVVVEVVEVVEEDVSAGLEGRARRRG